MNKSEIAQSKFVVTAFCVFNSGFFQYMSATRLGAEEWVRHFCPDSPEVEIRETQLVERAIAESQAPQPLTTAFLVCNSGFPQYIFLQRDDAECCADSEFGDSPEVEIKAVNVHERKAENVESDNDNRRDRDLRSGDTSSDSELRNASSVELGDGEPSPPRSKYYCACCKNLCEKPGIWCNYCFTQIAMNSKHKCDQGAAQEVSHYNPIERKLLAICPECGSKELPSANAADAREREAKAVGTVE